MAKLPAVLGIAKLIADGFAQADKTREPKVVAMTCPKCGGAVQTSTGANQCFCTYCGTPLNIDDGAKTVTYREVDEARLKELEYERELEKLRMELDEKHRPGQLKLSGALAVLGMIMVIAGFFLGHASGDSNDPWYMVAILGMFPLMAGGFSFIGHH